MMAVLPPEKPPADLLRKFRDEDLLGRQRVQLDQSQLRDSIRNRTVLVTGAGGSIGSELCAQLAAHQPSKLVLLGFGESSLVAIERSLRETYKDLRLETVLADIRNRDAIDRTFREHTPEYVYHTAAYKHVHLMEAHPEEAVMNNVRGTRILAEAARKHHCERFIMISSDKAVRPTGIYGATKRMGELLIHSMNGGPTAFTAVRFGNVIGSSGSVIPVFRRQLANGGPLTITHRDMTRYFMSIPEAAGLALQCGSISTAGDIFVLEMGPPIRILDLARNMIRLSGLRENLDITIEEIGTRPGEKLFEELYGYGEELQPTGVPKVDVLKRQIPSSKEARLLEMISRIELYAGHSSTEQLREAIRQFIALDAAALTPESRP